MTAGSGVRYLPPLYKPGQTPGVLKVNPQWAYVPPVRPNFVLNLDREETTCDTGIRLTEADRRRRQEFPFQDTNRYPTKLIEEALARLIADDLGLGESNVLIGNGSMNIMTYLYDIYTRPGDNITVPVPSFWPAYNYAMQRALGIYLPFYEPRKDDPGRPAFRFPVSHITEALSEGCSLCYICNPNNPTGTLIEFAEVRHLAEQFPGTLFIVDEAYGPFAANSLDPAKFDLTEAIDSIRGGARNVAVMRTFSKVYAMANYRIGYIVSHEANIETVRAYMGPYDIDEIPLAMAYYNYQDNEFMKDIVRTVVRNKLTYQSFLEENGIAHYGGYRNSVLVEGLDLGEGYERKGIAVRSMVYPENIPNPIASTFRVTIPADEKNFRFFMKTTEQLVNEELLPALRFKRND
jgi:histidinol-phosphate aminotransferase